MRARRPRLLVSTSLLAAVLAVGSTAAESPIALVVHGGAGTIERADLDAETEAAYRRDLTAALEAGYEVLARGGSSLDAVEATIRLLEDSPLFNAGKGAVFTAEGHNELDASIMDGATREAGAVAGVSTLKNPISAARAVMERSPHVLLAGEGAERFARAAGLEEVEPEHFYTERRWRALEKAREKNEIEKPPVDTDGDAAGASPSYLGTVGAVALDRAGRLAAGTSTGGMTFKRHGRVGDSPIVGAGTWADSRCGVSSTGHGEYFIRYAVAHDVCARVRYLGLSIEEAARQVIVDELAAAGGAGGVVALDHHGRPALVMNTPGMYRGYVGSDGQIKVSIFRDED